MARDRTPVQRPNIKKKTGTDSTDWKNTKSTHCKAEEEHQRQLTYCSLMMIKLGRLKLFLGGNYADDPGGWRGTHTFWNIPPAKKKKK